MVTFVVGILVFVLLFVVFASLRRPLRSRLTLPPDFAVSDSERETLYDMVARMNEIFETNSVEYFASGGTCLGAVRHQGMVPWDDDVDIYVDLEDLRFVESLFPKNGLRTERFGLFGLKIFNESSSFPWIDVFAATESEGRFVVAFESAKPCFPKASFSIESLRPVRRLKFGPTYVQSARDPEEHLDFFFGPKWRTTAVLRETSHRHIKSTGPLEFSVTSLGAQDLVTTES